MVPEGMRVSLYQPVHWLVHDCLSVAFSVTHLSVHEQYNNLLQIDYDQPTAPLNKYVYTVVLTVPHRRTYRSY